MEQTTNNPENDILVMDVYLIITDGKTVADVRFHLTSAVGELEQLKASLNQEISDYVIVFQSQYFCDPKDIKTIVYPIATQMTESQYGLFSNNYISKHVTKLAHE